MAQTNAERQAAYREKMKQSGDRINMVLQASTANKLRALCDLEQKNQVDFLTEMIEKSWVLASRSGRFLQDSMEQKREKAERKRIERKAGASENKTADLFVTQ